MSNPLLSHGFRIPWNRIRAEHVAPAVREALGEAERELQALIGDPAPRTYGNTIGRLDALLERLERTIGPAQHLVDVMNAPDLRSAYETVLPEFSAFYARLALNSGLWSAIRSFAETPEAEALTGVRRRHLEKTVREFVRAGADLPPEQKAKVEQIRVELSRLQTEFSNHTLDATNAWELVVTDRADLAGLPTPRWRRRAPTQRRREGKAGGSRCRFHRTSRSCSTRSDVSSASRCTRRT